MTAKLWTAFTRFLMSAFGVVPAAPFVDVVQLCAERGLQLRVAERNLRRLQLSLDSWQRVAASRSKLKVAFQEHAEADDVGKRRWIECYVSVADVVGFMLMRPVMVNSDGQTERRLLETEAKDRLWQLVNEINYEADALASFSLTPKR